jgi:hypothetical protein
MSCADKPAVRRWTYGKTDIEAMSLMGVPGDIEAAQIRTRKPSATTPYKNMIIVECTASEPGPTLKGIRVAIFMTCPVTDEISMTIRQRIRLIGDE